MLAYLLRASRMSRIDTGSGVEAAESDLSLGCRVMISDMVVVPSALIPLANLFTDEKRGTLPVRPVLRFFRQWVSIAGLFGITLLLREAYLRGLLF